MRVPLSLLLCLCAAPALAQHTHAPAAQPYAGLQNREIKALSAEDLAGLREGRGMSLALAAELNGYPGPMHALELASVLQLTPDQRTRIEEIMGRMRRHSQTVGAELIEAERHLDRRFQNRHIDKATLAAAMQTIGDLQGRLRNIHLDAHIDMASILTPEQITAYNAARGYAAGHPASAGSPHKH